MSNWIQTATTESLLAESQAQRERLARDWSRSRPTRHGRTLLHPWGRRAA